MGRGGIPCWETSTQLTSLFGPAFRRVVTARFATFVEHARACKVVYENPAFGDAHLAWHDQIVDGNLSTVSTATEWLRRRHELLSRSVASLSDDELPPPRKVNRELGESRRIISIVIEHDLYHAGEINHIRALCVKDDRWAHEGK
jgi:hypothetical protein